MTPMAALRAATADRHRRLEDDLDLLADDLTPERWSAALRRLLAVVEPLEAAIDAGPPPIDDWAERRRAALLRADAGDPDVAPSGALPDVSTTARALGALYVLEGSTLGGRVVTAHVRRVLGPDAGTRWFTAYGDEAPARWASFRRAASEGHDVDELVGAATATFDALLRA